VWYVLLALFRRRGRNRTPISALASTNVFISQRGAAPATFGSCDTGCRGVLGGEIFE
jgi:hypothetical protein